MQKKNIRKKNKNIPIYHQLQNFEMLSFPGFAISRNGQKGMRFRAHVQRNMSTQTAWTAPDDDILQDADKACHIGKKSTSAKQALDLQLKCTERVIYDRATFLLLSPSERDRVMRAKREAFSVRSKTTINKIKKKEGAQREQGPQGPCQDQQRDLQPGPS